MLERDCMYLDASSSEKPWPVSFIPDLIYGGRRISGLPDEPVRFSFSHVIHIVSSMASLLHPRVPAHLINDPSGVYC